MLSCLVITVVLALVTDIRGSFISLSTVHDPQLGSGNKINYTTKIHEVNMPEIIYVINVLGIKNGSAGHVNEILHNDIIEKALNETLGDLRQAPKFMLLVKQKNEHEPVNLNDVAENAEKEGFDAEKFTNEGETRFVKLHLIPFNSTLEIKENPNQEPVEAYAGNRLLKTRVKRTLCMSCMFGGKKKKFKKGGGGGRACGCRCGNCYQQPRVRTVYRTTPIYVPVYVQSHPVCNPCAHG